MSSKDMFEVASIPVAVKIDKKTMKRLEALGKKYSSCAPGHRHYTRSDTIRAALYLAFEKEGV